MVGLKIKANTERQNNRDTQNQFSVLSDYYHCKVYEEAVLG